MVVTTKPARTERMRRIIAMRFRMIVTQNSGFPGKPEV
jgi:hypothetical protein